jgi:uncharacterized membrane protein
MSDFIGICYEDQHTAFAVRAELVKLQKEYLIEMDDVVVVTKDEDGKTQLHQAVNLTAAGAVRGSFWGMLVGLIFLDPIIGLVGAAAGAGAGALSGKLADIGIDDNFMKELAATFTPGSSALFVLVRKSTPDKVLDAIKEFKGKVIHTSLIADDEQKLRSVLEAA